MPVDNLYLVQLDEIPGLVRWIEVSRQAGYVSAEEAGKWWFRIKAWTDWLELPEHWAH